MAHFLLIFFEWVIVVVSFSVFILLCIWIWSTFKTKLPFIPIPSAILGDIYKAADIQEGSVVYHLGAGDGRVLFYSATKEPNATYIGIENNAFALLLSHVYGLVYRKRNKRNGATVKIVSGDFFAQDLSSATHIFMYTPPQMMDDMLPKFDKELKSGTRLISVVYKFTVKQPNQEIDLEREGYAHARTLCIYEF